MQVHLGPSTTALPHEKETFLTLPCRMVILVSITYSRPEIGAFSKILSPYTLLLRGHDGTTNVLLIVSTRIPNKAKEEGLPDESERGLPFAVNSSFSLPPLICSH